MKTAGGKPKGMPAKLATIDECCEMLRLIRQTVYRLCHVGELEAVQIGGCRRVKMASLERLVERGTSPAS